MTIKELRDKRNNEIAAGKKLVSGAKAEKRSLNHEETEKFTKHYNAATKLNDKIAEVRSKGALKDSMAKVAEKRGVNAMSKDKRAKMETRALGHYLRTGNTEELRDLDATQTEGNAQEATPGNGGVTVPQAVDSQVITKLTEDAPVINAVRHIPSMTGTLTVVREGNTDENGFVGEAKNLNKMNETLDTVTLDQKRVGAWVELTGELLNDSAVNLVNYSVNRLSWSFAKAVERAILLGKDTKGQKSFQPIIGDSHIKNLTFSGQLTPDNVLDMYDGINPQYLRNAMFVVSRPAFDQLTKMKDGNGQYLIFRDNSSDTPGIFKFKGVPVYVSDTLNNASTNMVLGDFNAGYALMIKKGMTLTHVTQDTQQALAGGHLIVLSAYMDGAVINPDAFITANASVSGGGAPVSAPKSK